MLRVYYFSLEGVILFGPEVTNDLDHVCIRVVEGNIGDGPLGRILMDPTIAIRHVLPGL